MSHKVRHLLGIASVDPSEHAIAITWAQDWNGQRLWSHFGFQYNGT